MLTHSRQCQQAAHLTAPLEIGEAMFLFGHRQFVKDFFVQGAFLIKRPCRLVKQRSYKNRSSVFAVGDNPFVIADYRRKAMPPT